MSIEFKHVTYYYAPGSPTESLGLKDVSFSLQEKQFVALIGHTGSGKSTLMQHFNALLKPTKGEVDIAGYKIGPKTGNKNLKPLRRHVSLVFQFPEAQLFEDTVIKDISFAPLNFGMSAEDAKRTAAKWLVKVGLDSSLANRSPFELSGGQMRRVAIAGVMAYEPDILLLDEPAAGLDPQGKRQMMDLFKNYQESGHTVILVTHNMDDVAEYATDTLVLDHGRLVKHGRPQEVFARRDWVLKHHLQEPTASRFANRLEKKGFHFAHNPLTRKDLVRQILQQLGGVDNE